MKGTLLTVELHLGSVWSQMRSTGSIKSFPGLELFGLFCLGLGIFFLPSLSFLCLQCSNPILVDLAAGKEELKEGNPPKKNHKTGKKKPKVSCREPSLLPVRVHLSSPS